MEPILQAVQRAKTIVRPAPASTAVDASVQTISNRNSDLARQGSSGSDTAVPLAHVELQWDQLLR